MAAHYTPAAYLGHFANPSADSARTQKLWAFRRGEEEPVHAPASRLAQEHDVYSAKDPGTAEQYFGFFERDLRAIFSDAVRLSAMTKATNRSHVGTLMLHHALLMVIRSPLNVPSDGRDRFDAVQPLFDEMHHRWILGMPPDQSIARTVADRLDLPLRSVESQWTNEKNRLRLVGRAVSTRWNWRVLRTKSRADLYTSDNPAQFLEVGDGQMVTLPISKRHLFVAATTEHAIVLNRALPIELVQQINGQTMDACYRFLFSSEPFGPEDRSTIRDHFDRHPNPSPLSLSSSSWESPIRKAVHPDRVGFLRMVV